MYTDEYIRKGKVVNVIDGDTIDIQVDLGYHISTLERFRLLRVNTPEVYGDEKPEGLISKAFTESKLLNQQVVFQSTKTDSFKRWLAEIWYTEDGVQKNISDELLNNGLAVPYVK